MTYCKYQILQKEKNEKMTLEKVLPSDYTDSKEKKIAVTLYCTVLYCTVLYCTVLYCTALYSNIA